MLFCFVFFLFKTLIARVLLNLLFVFVFIFTPSYRKYISCTILISTGLFKLRVHKKKRKKIRMEKGTL